MPSRDATASDAVELARIDVAAWQAGYRGLMPDDFLAGLSEERSTARWQSAFAKNPPLVLVVEHDGEVVGACRYGGSRDADATPCTGEVMALNVHPTAWRRGVGTELLQAVLERLRLLRFTTATLWVLDKNSRARAFYEAAGFSKEGAERTETDLIGSPLHEIRYRTTLTAV